MKIAILSPSFLPAVGGMEFVVHSLAVEWGKQGHEVLVVNAVSERPTHPEANYSVARFQTMRGAPRLGYHRFPFSGYTRRSIEKILRGFDPDFISAHMGYPTGHWLESARGRRRYVVTCHGRDITHFDWGFRKRYGIDRQLRDALNHSIGAIAISTHARRMMEELGVSSSVIRDIPNGVDLERFQKSVEFDFRKRLGLEPEALIVLSVGREHPQKDYKTGIQAFLRVAQAEENVYYVIAGDKVSAHQTLIDELDLSERVRFSGVLHGDAMVGAYQQSDIFFSSSIWEMMPLVVLESMATGLPAVVTNVSGSQDLVVDGETGFVVEPRKAEALADALLDLVRDQDKRERFRQNVLRRASDYSWDEISRRYLSLA
ncbi:MAG: glycosyltransferase family 4 protein [Myxococcota bacterium]|nr:glycosyltransferase family 4 protein [Myxococcota bacterium]